MADNRKMSPFNLELAKQGKEICTREGNKARIVSYNGVTNRSIIALVTLTDDDGENEREYPVTYYPDGKLYKDPNDLSDLDLMMAYGTKTGYIHIPHDMNFFDNEEIAKKNCPDGYIVCRIEIES